MNSRQLKKLISEILVEEKKKKKKKKQDEEESTASFEDLETVQDAWAGGENLENPVDWMKTGGVKLKESQLRRMISEEIANVLLEAKRPGESIADMVSRLMRRGRINMAGQPEDFMNQYYIDVRGPQGDLLKRHSYRHHDDASVEDEVARIKMSMNHPGGSEYQIIKDTEDGESFLGSIF